MTSYAALYCRLSPRPDGSYEGVDAQERWGRDYAAKTWPGVPVKVFADKGISAANGDERPEFERFREAVARGEVAHVWAVEQTRLERREVEWFRLAAEFDAAGIAELHTNRDGIVRVRDDVAGIKAVLAASEVRKLKRRVNDRLDTIAAEGRPAGSVVFGYRHAKDKDGGKTLAVIPEQAEAVRWAAEQVLSGWSLANIAAALRERGLRGAHGGTITPGGVRSMVTNPTVAGYRVHRGEIVGRGIWPAILDESTWQAVRAKLAAPRQVRRVDGGTYDVGAAHNGNSTGRRYLLTGGTTVCGVCAAPLVGTLKQLRNSKGVRSVPYYGCHPKMTGPQGPGRGCVGIMGEALEAHVASELFDWLEGPDYAAALGTDDHVARRDELTTALGDVERDRVELAREWATPGALTMTEWRTARQALAERERTLHDQLNAVPPSVERVDPRTVRASWGRMTLDEQREHVAMFVMSVTVNRAARRGGPGFDPDRVDVQFANMRV